MHTAVYDILVRDCKANHWLWLRQKFATVDLDQPLEARYHFGTGRLRRNARFKINAEGVWFVDHHERERTEKRDTMVARANAALRELQGR